MQHFGTTLALIFCSSLFDLMNEYVVRGDPGMMCYPATRCGFAHLVISVRCVAQGILISPSLCMHWNPSLYAMSLSNRKTSTPTMYKIFVDSIMRSGRVHELGFMISFYFKRGTTIAISISKIRTYQELSRDIKWSLVG